MGAGDGAAPVDPREVVRCCGAYGFGGGAACLGGGAFEV